jgi:3-hydroxyisobutyrate dehydrogenase-like beta-hydroxyacid dehydrogenase
MRLAFLGLGIMGSRMAMNLDRAGFELTVWNRTTETAKAFGAEHPRVSVAASPQAAATAADVVFSMVVDGAQVREILLGESGAARGAQPGTVFVDCSTIGVEEAIALGQELDELEMRFLDAPVTGSSPAAQAGTLTFMVGGERADFERVEPVLDAMGRLLVHVGPRGGSAAGADLDALVRVLGSGAASSGMLDLKAKPMITHDYATLFKLDHMLKDVRLCLETAARAGITFPFAEATERTLSQASALGFGDVDFAALIEALQVDSGTSL